MKTPIVLLSDFGIDDPYIGIMKGMINTIHNGVSIIDLSHSIPKYNVESASYILETSEEFFSPFTIFVCVVDPGVGSDRKCLLVQYNDKIFIAPDNGILKFLDTSKIEIYEIEITYKFHKFEKSNTFHGRDIFAPLAALISKYLFELNFKTEKANINFEDLIYLKSIDKNETFTFQDMQVNEYNNYKIIWIDSFGNCISNLKKQNLDVKNVEIKGLIIENICTKYADVKILDKLVYYGSTNYLEFAINQGNFAKEFDIEIGQKIIINKKTGI